MRTNWVREKLHRGQATVGCFLGLGSPNVAELLAHAGFDWLVIETEHNGLDSAEIEHMLMAMSGTATVRMLSVCQAHKVACGRGDSSPEALRSWRDLGCTFLTYGPDYALLVEIATEGLRTLRR